MSIICITQARLTSSRLPSKVLLPITTDYNAITLLKTRVSRSSFIDKHIFAIPDTKANLPLASFLDNSGIPYIAGPEHDLIQRHLMACTADIRAVVRITSDCPLVDPVWIDRAIEVYMSGYDYVSTYTPAESSLFCNGSDIEIFSIDLLKILSEKFLLASDREHVTFPLWDGRLKCNYSNLNHLIPEPINDIRITLDYREDLNVLRSLSGEINVASADLLSIARIYRKLKLHLINGDIRYDAGWNKE